MDISLLIILFLGRDTIFEIAKFFETSDWKNYHATNSLDLTK